MNSSRKVLALAVVLPSVDLHGNKSATALEGKTAAKEFPRKHYTLPGNKDTVQWVWFDPAEKPRWVVNQALPFP